MKAKARSPPLSPFSSQRNDRGLYPPHGWPRDGDGPHGAQHTEWLARGPYNYSAWAINRINASVTGSATAVSAPDARGPIVPEHSGSVRAPENWQPSTLSHGLSLVAVNRYQSLRFHLHDQDGAGGIDTTNAEVMQFSLYSGSNIEDSEMGSDGALYTSTYNGTVQRCAWSGGSLAPATFFTIGGSGNSAASAESFSIQGLAIDKARASGSPVVYAFAKDSNGKVGIFSLKDGDGGGVSPSDSQDRPPRNPRRTSTGRRLPAGPAEASRLAKRRERAAHRGPMRFSAGTGGDPLRFTAGAAQVRSRRRPPRRGRRAPSRARRGRTRGTRDSPFGSCRNSPRCSPTTGCEGR